LAALSADAAEGSLLSIEKWVRTRIRQQGLGETMELAGLLESKRKAILGEWIQVVIKSYPAATGDLLGKQKDPFRNPVGHAISEGLGRVFDEIRASMDTDELLSALDVIIRIRSIQDFTPSEAVSFVFGLKTIIRMAIAADARTDAMSAELANLDSRIDRVALLAFEKYTACREKLYEIKVSEIRKRMIERLHASNIEIPSSIEERRAVCDET
jgi:hypothetical protein